ncbi:DNA polymerase III subunit gamma/tau [bacterium]|nr:DNA polymerase III subunit gamma/tau [bacterium]
MSYVVMARKWRPRTFDTVVGQDHVVRTLKNAISANRISHAYLFTGPRGVGKTSSARLLAKAVNCLSPESGEPCNHCVRCEEIMSNSTTDVIEIDAASNGLVDDARELREKVRYAPATCRYKVIIIDEVHMMSNAAFNALLKTLEEPPAHTIFILATTESHKVPATIMSRCQRFDFRRIPEKEIAERLAVMAAAEKITVEEEALHVIARGADGSLRDGQSLFDQIVSFSGNDVTTEDVITVLGLVDAQVFVALVDAIAQKVPADAMEAVDRLVNNGADLRLFMKDWVEYWRSLVMLRVVGRKPPTAHEPATTVEQEAQRQSGLFSLEELLNLAKIAVNTDDQLRRTQHPRLLLELLLLQLCSADRLVSLESLWRQLQAMETRVAQMPETAVLSSGAGTVPDQQPVVPAAAVSEEALGIEKEPKESQSSIEGERTLVVDALEDAAELSYHDKVKENWDAIMQLVGQENRRVQALLRDATLTGAEEGLVELTCASVYHRTGLEKEDARKVIETVLESELGRRTRIQLKCEEDVKNEKGPAQATEKDKEKEFEDITRNEPLVRKTLEMFGGKIVDIIQKPAGGKK